MLPQQHLTSIYKETSEHFEIKQNQSKTEKKCCGLKFGLKIFSI